MAVAMILVGLLAGDVHPDHDNEGGEHVRGRVDGVGDHGPGVGKDTRQELPGGQD